MGDPLGEERALELMAKLRAAQGKMAGALEARAAVTATGSSRVADVFCTDADGILRQAKSAWQWCWALKLQFVCGQWYSRCLLTIVWCVVYYVVHHFVLTTLSRVHA